MNLSIKRFAGSKNAVWPVLLAALALRLISLNQSLWLDEATSANVAGFSFAKILVNFSPSDFHPPLYYFVMKIWVSLFGSSEISLRIPSVISGMATVFFIYKIGKKLFGQRTALTAALLASTSGLLIYYSQEARMYALSTALVTLSVYLLLEKRYLLFSVVLAAIGMTDYVSLFVLPVFWLFAYRDKKFQISNLPLVAMFAVWLPVFLRQLSNGLSVKSSLPAWWNTLGTPTLKNIALIPVKFALGRISFDNTMTYALVVFAVLGIFSYILLKSLKGNRFLWAWMLIPVILGIIISFKIPTLSYFRFLFALPPFYLLLANGVCRFEGRRFLFLTVVLLTINILSSLYYLLNPKFQREDWRSAAKAIGSQMVVFPADSQKEALIYYKKGSQVVDITGFDGRENTVWLSRYVWGIFDPGDNARKKMISLGYNKVRQADFNGVVFWEYTKNKQ